MEGKTLHLTLKKQWFDMILSGDKKEEYREIKPYWEKRLFASWSVYAPFSVRSTIYPNWYIKVENSFCYETITFKNGYASDAPEIVVELKGIKIGIGKREWGGSQVVKYFVLSLGEILSTKNIKP